MPVMHLEPGVAADLGMTAFSSDGRALAAAGHGLHGRSGPRQRDGVAEWRLHVRPGVDAVLITSCILAVLLLLPNSARASLQPSLQPRLSERSSTLPSLARLSVRQSSGHH
mmetsp:Transcript_97712/g.304408  ORF Transcript_97712/g.304408 Transcript_97712/m.304408 type:complete len:111 (+) Transcript_97712:705-1037(+)